MTDFGDIRTDEIFVVVTVGKRLNSYVLRKTQPKGLAPNEYCFKFTIQVDKKEWFDRVEDVALKVRPPSKLLQSTGDISFGKTTTEKVIDRLSGRGG